MAVLIMTGIEAPGTLRANQFNDTSGLPTVDGSGHINSNSIGFVSPFGLKTSATVFLRIPPRLPVAPISYEPGANPVPFLKTTLILGSCLTIYAAG